MKEAGVLMRKATVLGCFILVVIVMASLSPVAGIAADALLLGAIASTGVYVSWVLPLDGGKDGGGPVR